ncbi:hypothetical protein HDE_08271 [Halotydeus destructor]|nr:hypothetical protein HDE_08271 [Halotydeus destructor]
MTSQVSRPKLLGTKLNIDGISIYVYSFQNLTVTSGQHNPLFSSLDSYPLLPTMSEVMTECISESYIDDFVLITLSDEAAKPQSSESALLKENKSNSTVVKTVTFHCRGEPLCVRVDTEKVRKSRGKVAEFMTLLDHNSEQLTCRTDWSRKALEVVVKRWAFNIRPPAMDEETCFELLSLASHPGRGVGSDPIWACISFTAESQLAERLTVENCIHFFDTAIKLQALYLDQLTRHFIRNNLSQLAMDLHVLSPASRKAFAAFIKFHHTLPCGQLIDVDSVIRGMNGRHE